MAPPGRKPPDSVPQAGPRRTSVVVFPFDCFGGSGAGAGAELIADELREIVADNRREMVPTRADAYTKSFASKNTPLTALWPFMLGAPPVDRPPARSWTARLRISSSGWGQSHCRTPRL